MSKQTLDPAADFVPTMYQPDSNLWDGRGFIFLTAGSAVAVAGLLWITHNPLCLLGLVFTAIGAAWIMFDISRGRRHDRAVAHYLSHQADVHVTVNDLDRARVALYRKMVRADGKVSPGPLIAFERNGRTVTLGCKRAPHLNDYLWTVSTTAA